MKWKDESSYSRGEAKVPHTWVARPGMLRLSVHRHIHHPGAWMVSCDPFWSARPLQSTNVDEAKAEAMGMLVRALNDAIDALED